jgi:hypothetical protein
MKVMMEGEKYLKASFDNLDVIKSATVISGEPAAMPKPAAKKAPPAAKKK